jgi:hypothetical protein
MSVDHGNDRLLVYHSIWTNFNCWSSKIESQPIGKSPNNSTDEPFSIKFFRPKQNPSQSRLIAELWKSTIISQLFHFDKNGSKHVRNVFWRMILFVTFCCDESAETQEFPVNSSHKISPTENTLFSMVDSSWKHSAAVFWTLTEPLSFKMRVSGDVRADELSKSLSLWCVIQIWSDLRWWSLVLWEWRHYITRTILTTMIAIHRPDKRLNSKSFAHFKCGVREKLRHRVSFSCHYCRRSILREVHCQWMIHLLIDWRLFSAGIFHDLPDGKFAFAEHSGVFPALKRI